MPGLSRRKNKINSAPQIERNYHEIPVSRIMKGDVICIYSGRRILPREVKVRSVMSFPDGIHLDTTIGKQIIPPGAVIKVPKL